MSAVRLRLTSILLAGLTAFAANQARGQAPDSTRSLPDAVDSALVVPAPKLTTVRPAIEVDVYREGTRSDTTPLVQVYANDIVEFLDRVPGSFRYSMGNIGWPDQWSPQGSAPGHVALTLDGIPLQDPVTDRPLFEVLPFGLLSSPSFFGGRRGSADGVGFTTRRFDVRSPLTELRYRSGQPGLQSISATHAQQRRVQAIGSPSLLQVVFNYSAGSWDGDYPNSSSDVSQVYARIGLFTPGWALRISNLHTRRKGGAHGGVRIPSGRGFDSVFTRFNATVENPSATFHLKRNDLQVAIDRRVLKGVRPLSVSLSWVSHVRRYREVTTSEAQIEEYTIAATQEIPAILPHQTLVARFTARFDDVRSGTVFGDSTGLDRSYVEGVVETNVEAGSLSFAGHVGFVEANDHFLPQMRASATVPLVGFRVSSAISLSGRGPSRLEESGSDHITVPLTGDLVAEKSRRITTSLQRPLGSSSMRLDVFALSRHSPIEVWQIAPDAFMVTQSSTDFTSYGLTAVLGWRDAATRGFYGTLQSTVQGSSATSDDAFHTAINESLPAFHGRLRLGARYVLFEGDLDLDVYVIGRYWSSFRSRVFDPITGVLALNRADARMIGNSGTLDVRVEAGIRSATVFAGFENVLAGVSYPGALLVPVYPLAAQAFRFGIHWPIDD